MSHFPGVVPPIRRPSDDLTTVDIIPPVLEMRVHGSAPVNRPLTTRSGVAGVLSRAYQVIDV